MSKLILEEVEKDNIAILAAMSAVTNIYYMGCVSTIKKINLHSEKIKYKFDTLSASNKKYVEKEKINKTLKALDKVNENTNKVLKNIENSMRDALGDEIVDELIDKIADSVKDIKLKDLIKKYADSTKR